MPATDARSIVQVLVLFDETNSREYGLALWAALHEVEAFYHQSHPNVTFKRFYLSRHVPQPGWMDRFVPDRVKGIFNVDVSRSAQALLSQESSIGAMPTIDEKKRRTYDQEKLADQIPGIIRAGAEDTNFVIVTDRSITPPPQWRYIIWDTIKRTNHRAIVISAAPLDPNYWRDKDPDRINTIKSRVRAACMSVTGTLLDFDRCENPICFLFDNVDSVTVLDEMAVVGAEHKCKELQNKGFDESSGDPNFVHSPILRMDVS